MNATPHRHNLKLEVRASGGFFITYGDQHRTIGNGPFLERRLKRKIRKIIQAHDKGSQNAGRIHDIMENAGQSYLSEWATDAPNVDELDTRKYTQQKIQEGTLKILSHD